MYLQPNWSQASSLAIQNNIQKGGVPVVTGKVSEQSDPMDLLLIDDAATYRTSMILPS